LVTLSGLYHGGSVGIKHTKDGKRLDLTKDRRRDLKKRKANNI
jgi:hypothetical protein